jgi:predicted lactoylglutathione lyase
VNLNAVGIKAFVPAIDFERSMQFYQALGFEVPRSDGETA